MSVHCVLLSTQCGGWGEELGELRDAVSGFKVKVSVSYRSRARTFRETLIFRDVTNYKFEFESYRTSEHFSDSKSIEFCDGFSAVLNSVCISWMGGMGGDLFTINLSNKKACMFDLYSATSPRGLCLL